MLRTIRTALLLGIFVSGSGAFADDKKPGPAKVAAPPKDPKPGKKAGAAAADKKTGEAKLAPKPADPKSGKPATGDAKKPKS